MSYRRLKPARILLFPGTSLEVKITEANSGRLKGSVTLLQVLRGVHEILASISQQPEMAAGIGPKLAT